MLQSEMSIVPILDNGVIELQLIIPAVSSHFMAYAEQIFHKETVL